MRLNYKTAIVYAAPIIFAIGCSRMTPEERFEHEQQQRRYQTVREADQRARELEAELRKLERETQTFTASVAALVSEINEFHGKTSNIPKRKKAL